jgi:hypothetical protein
MIKHGVTSLTTGKVLTGTQQAVSFHWRNTAEVETGMTEICTTSSAAEMHVVGSKTSIRSSSASNRSSVKKGTTITMLPIMTNLIDSVLPKGVQCRSQILFPRLKRVHWPLNFKPSVIKKYDGSTNPAEWLEVYQLTNEAADGDSYIMANYLQVCLSSSTRTWLLMLPTGSVHSWNHLCQLFTSNFHATCACMGVS